MSQPQNTLQRPMPQADTAAFAFYDIESLENVFTTCIYHSKTHKVDVFYLIDNPTAVPAPNSDTLLEHIKKANPAWVKRSTDADVEPQINVYNLADDNGPRQLALALGGISSAPLVHNTESTNANPNISEDLRPICDTFYKGLVKDDKLVWDPTVHPFIVGYNSFNYDTTMLAIYFALAYSDQDCTARELRRHNDNLFSAEIRSYMPAYLYRHDEGSTISRINGTNIAKQIRDNMIASGRHLDVARLNEVQRHIGLKRLLGMEGHQILESDKLSNDTKITNTEEFIELIAYNVSDVVGTAMLFENNVYSGAFNLRAGLINTYPEVVFDHTGDFATPNIHPDTVRAKRLTYDSFSAQFAGTILAPYRPLHDIPGHQADRPAVSFLYPDPQVAEELGTTATNVLEDARDFFYEHVPDTTESGKLARKQFDDVYNYYRSIEGKNFNQLVHKDVHEVAEYIRRNLVEALNDLTELTKTNSDPTLHDYVGRIIPNTLTQYNTVFPSRIDQINAFDDGQSPKKTHVRKALALLDPITDIFVYADKMLYVNLNVRNSPKKSNCFDGMRDIDYLVGFIENYTHYAGVSEQQRQRHDESDYEFTWPLENYEVCYELDKIQKLPNNIPYYFVDEDENVYDTGCFVTFSTGGIHGAEYNAALYNHTREAYNEAMARFSAIIDQALADMKQPDEALARLIAFEGKQKPTNADNKRFTQAKDGIDDWVNTVLGDESLLEKVPSITPYTSSNDGNETPDPYTPTELISAAWWIRKVLRLVVTNPITGEEELADYKDVIASGKADAPFLRSKPTRVKDISLFETQNSTKYTHNDEPHQATKLKDSLVYTSVGEMVHEDFASYYPLMLTNMAAFSNPDLAKAGSNPDRYRDIFGQKETYGKMMKDKDTYTDAERAYFAIQREGVKLILNSASGAADAGHSTPILMNNTVISMRLIGQILTWTVAQAQSFIGGRAPSTNTDGVYMDIAFDKGAATLEALEPIINVQIEPESLLLVSKDSNNRIEFEATSPLPDNPLDLEVAAVGGGTLAAYFGPNPRKSLAHPAVEDRILGDYFKLIAHGGYIPEGHDTPLRIGDEMHRDTVAMLLEKMEDELGVSESLRYYQNLIASSPAVGTYLFAATGIDDATWTPGGKDDTVKLDLDNYTLLGHFNRMFMVTSDDKAAQAGLNPVRIGAIKARKVSEAQLKSRRKAQDISDNAFPANRCDTAALHLYKQAGITPDAVMRGNNDIGVFKHSGVDPTQPAVIVNRSLKHSPDADVDKVLFDMLDRQAYIDSIIATYEENWRNEVVGEVNEEIFDFRHLTPYNDSPVSQAQAQRLTQGNVADATNPTDKTAPDVSHETTQEVPPAATSEPSNTTDNNDTNNSIKEDDNPRHTPNAHDLDELHHTPDENIGVDAQYTPTPPIDPYTYYRDTNKSKPLSVSEYVALSSNPAVSNTPQHTTPSGMSIAEYKQYCLDHNVDITQVNHTDI